MAKRTDARTLFSRNLTRIRKEAGFSQFTLAKKAGLTHNFINDLENAKKGTSMKTLDKLSEALNADLVQFFVEPAQWDKTDKMNYLALVDNLNNSLNKLFEDYRELSSKKK